MEITALSWFDIGMFSALIVTARMLRYILLRDQIASSKQRRIGFIR